MESVLKFGGSSLGSAQRLLDAVDIVTRALEHSRTSGEAHEPQRSSLPKIGLVVSAFEGVTDLLFNLASEAAAGRKFEHLMHKFSDRHMHMASDLETIDPKLNLETAKKAISEATEQIGILLNLTQAEKCCSPEILDHIVSHGERLSAAFFDAALRERGLSVEFLRAEETIITNSSFGRATPLVQEVRNRLERCRAKGAEVLLLPGFYGATEDGRITTLGRGGSDYSAALLAAGLKAKSLQIWTSIDGLHNCDPEVVPDASPILELSYAEAMEMAFFGAKVLHPSTLLPVVEAKIPTAIRNSLKPEWPGTWIYDEAKPSTGIVRGVTSLANIVMLNLSGTGMKGVPGTAARAFSALSRELISIIYITQVSSEYSIGLCVTKEDAERAESAIQQEFSKERADGRLAPVELIENLAILSIIGDNMREKRGVAATFFGALASIDVNIVSIAQGPSERNISAVIHERDRVRALRKCHEFFFNALQQIQLFLVGTGGVGGRLLEQITAQRAKLRKQKIDLRICGIGNTKGLLLSESGLEPTSDWRTQLKSGQPFALEAIMEHVGKTRPINPVLVDCTSDASIACRYPELFRAGLHVVTPNKKANSQSMDYYREIRSVADERRRRFLYETNVGAGLPVIDSLKNLMKSGDTLIEFQGILSGSLSFLFGLLEEGVPFSQAVFKAKELGFTEPDPRDDLCGVDVARKLLILARETGRSIELSDIRVESVLPAGFQNPEKVDDFMLSLKDLDNEFQARAEEAKRQDSVLRYVGTIRPDGCEVGIRQVARNHPLAAVRGGENALSFLSQRYQPTPLVIRGYGAGAEVTAAGVFADLLKTIFWNMDAV